MKSTKKFVKNQLRIHSYRKGSHQQYRQLAQDSHFKIGIRPVKGLTIF